MQRAIDQRLYRSARIEERIREMIAREAILIDTGAPWWARSTACRSSGWEITASVSRHRITATTRLGSGEVIDIEREVEMGGPIHSKGVMILAGYLGSRYAPDGPLSLSARLVFEQSYSGVEGDSASSAELYAILSSLSGLPIKQRFAVTGSVNQMGQVQAIGGANEKIEGFFAVARPQDSPATRGCCSRMPTSTTSCCSEEVREAVAAGRFHIYPVATYRRGYRHPDRGGGRPARTPVASSPRAPSTDWCPIVWPPWPRSRGSTAAMAGLRQVREERRGLRRGGVHRGWPSGSASRPARAARRVACNPETSRLQRQPATWFDSSAAPVRSSSSARACARLKRTVSGMPEPL